MGVAWVNGAIATYANSTTRSLTTPAAIAAGDGVFALVFTRSTCTPPAGWTLVTSDSAIDGLGTTQTLHIFRKTTVTSGDSSTSFTWTQATSGLMGVAYAVVRADAGLVVVAETASTTIDSTPNSTSILAPVLTATSGQGEMFIIAETCTSALFGFVPVPPTGSTAFTGSTGDGRLGGAYQVRTAGQSNADYYESSNESGDTGTVAITMRLREGRASQVSTESVQVIETLGVPGVTTDTVNVSSPALRASRASEVVSAPTTLRLPIDMEAALTTRAPAVTRTETTNIDAALDGIVYRFAVCQEEVGSWSQLAIKMRAGATATEVVRVLERVYRAQGLAAADSAGISSVIAGSRAIKVLDQLGAASQITAKTTTKTAVTTTLQISSELARFFGLRGVDAVGVVETISSRARFGRTSAEGMLISNVAIPRFVVRVIAPEAMQLTGSLVLKWVFNPVLTESVVMDAAYLAPNGALVTWAMNTRSAAVTEYTNYAYTSFAARQSHYLGTNNTGLYRLDGDTDSGAAIIARLRSGMMQMAGSRFTGFSAVYIGMHGSGDILFRMVSGDDKTYTYRVVVQNMQSTKVRMGKGLRARYFAFELETLGSDFDIDTVEFVPLTTQRRV